MRPITVVDIKIPPEIFAHEANTGRIMVKKVKITMRLARAVTRPISRRIKVATLFPSSTLALEWSTSDISLSFPFS
jgi:hypothetical protein